mmetsp:Transcript_73682/g.173063  ORF Transcript_73682/g.173063 Transcript_73682/m.173063 type:complete len:213 (+) Transcript_73682:66-704(+)
MSRFLRCLFLHVSIGACRLLRFLLHVPVVKPIAINLFACNVPTALLSLEVLRSAKEGSGISLASTVVLNLGLTAGHAAWATIASYGGIDGSAVGCALWFLTMLAGDIVILLVHIAALLTGGHEKVEYLLWFLLVCYTVLARWLAYAALEDPNYGANMQTIERTLTRDLQYAERLVAVDAVPPAAPTPPPEEVLTKCAHRMAELASTESSKLS